jgi:hypothetical protein
MQTKIELKRRWQEKFVLLLGLGIALFLLGRSFFFLPEFDDKTISIIFLLVWLYWIWISFTTPNILIENGKLNLYKRFSRKPIVISLNDIQTIKRNPNKLPIWQIPPLIFQLKDGNNVKFSTGADAKNMQRIINFLEKETPLKVERYEFV